MGARSRRTFQEAGQVELRLSRREARSLARRADRAARLQPRSTQDGTWVSRLRQTAAEGRATASKRPGRRGWAGKGVGRVNYVQPNPEYQGTTVQVCGLWPFIAGSGSPVIGAPLGRHLLNGSVVCADPIFWFLANLVLNPSCFVLGRPGLGKSTIVRRMVTVLEAWGIIPMVLSDTKPDYVDLITAMEGQVIRIGRGRGHLNPLDLGPLMRELEKIPDENKRREALDEMRGRRLTTVLGLLALVRGARLESYEASIVTEAIRILDEQDRLAAPVVGDITELVLGRHERLRALARDRGEIGRYDDRVQNLLDDLVALGGSGSFGDMFAKPTTEHIEMGRPMVFDMSSIDDGDLQMQAAVQSVCWNYGSAVVSADKHLAEAGMREQRHYFLVMDELWRMLRAADVMVYFIDALTRLNRQRAIGQAMITHTMNDLELASEHLTKIAWGFVERSAMTFLGGLAESEMGNLEKVFAMSSEEKSMITDWSAESGVNPESSTAAAPPGLGKFLLKIGKKPGVPFQSQLTDVELAVNNTNQSWKDAADRARTSPSQMTEEEAEMVA
ncbi:ATP-binding protein [Curtobacterium sp. MCBD17_026]|uniref:ATP-binding protein n=1 Tax=Curtobacterium sp. MCBD17_026 TaxID=2175621 RepID=UPI0011B4C725|nr:ATP-binding protein [Curtobacterium sp. MCBD17_026]WIB72607.1 ATP-binding protein [Curtobacterium sp. MCBD17_026]